MNKISVELSLTDLTELIMREYVVGYHEAANIRDYAIEPVLKEVKREAHVELKNWVERSAKVLTVQNIGIPDGQYIRVDELLANLSPIKQEEQ